MPATTVVRSPMSSDVRYDISEYAMHMSEGASERYHIELAPKGLLLVHELLNTISAGRPPKPNLLGALELAQPWLEQTVALWAARTGVGQPPEISLSDRDLPTLRALRDQLREAASRSSNPSGSKPTGSLRLTLTAGNKIAVRPQGQGARWVTAAVLGELYLAQQHDSWRRLKICRNELCGSAFYDRSRNNSGVWHDVRVCGNAANLRASRARRKQVAPHRP